MGTSPASDVMMISGSAPGAYTLEPNPDGSINIGPSDALSQAALNTDNNLRGTPADITDNTAHDVIAAQATGVRICVTGLLVTCSHATQGTVVKITDGSGGTTLYRGFAAANGGGFECPDFDFTTAATALSAICETNSSTVQITAHGFKATF